MLSEAGFWVCWFWGLLGGTLVDRQVSLTRNTRGGEYDFDVFIEKATRGSSFESYIARQSISNFRGNKSWSLVL